MTPDEDDIGLLRRAQEAHRAYDADGALVVLLIGDQLVFSQHDLSDDEIDSIGRTLIHHARVQRGGEEAQPA